MDMYNNDYRCLYDFPSTMTIGELCKLFEKQEEEKIKFEEECLKDKPDNVYYYEEIDDGIVICKFLIYVWYCFENKAICNVFIITEDKVEVEKDVQIEIDALNKAKKMPINIYFDFKETFDSLLSNFK